MPDLDEMFDLAELFKVFGDSTRIRILFALFGDCGSTPPPEEEKELNVSELAETLDMTQSAVSHQLKILRQAKLVKARREGKQMLYSLDDEHVFAIIAAGLEHIEEK